MNPFLQQTMYDMDVEGGVIYFCTGALSPGKLFTTYKLNTNLGNSEMRPVKILTDNLPTNEETENPGVTHTIYHQYYNNIRVEDGEYTEDQAQGYVILMSGSLVENLQMVTEPAISIDNALVIVRSYKNAETLELDSSVIDSTNEKIPGELVITYVSNEDNNSTTNYKLAWKLTVNTYNPNSNSTVYIDAQTGNVLKEYENSHLGDFNHPYYGFKSGLDTKYRHMQWPAKDRNYLFANDDTRNIYTTDNTDYHNLNNVWVYYDVSWGWDEMPYSAGDDNWGDDNAKATAAHYCAQKSWDFYRLYYNRIGLTGANGGWGKHLRIIAGIPASSAPTFYMHKRDNDYLIVSSTNGSYDATYDIIGHEFTHGVIENSRPLPYEKISGAINESFADIFGFMVEYYSLGYIKDWTLGEDKGTVIRDIKDPNKSNQPSHFQGPFWYSLIGITPTPANDYGGVHINSGVMNRWFYLLSKGGSEVVNGFARYVNGIGTDNAAYLAHYTMVNYKNYDANNTTFSVVRANSLAAAAILWGMNSPKYRSVCQAWTAVNVASCKPPIIQPQTCIWWGTNPKKYQKTTTLEEHNISKPKITLVPNPATTNFTIYIDDINSNHSDALSTVIITDISGRTSLKAEFDDLHNQRIDIDSLHPGVYIVTLTNANWVQTIRLVKQ